MSEEHEVIGEFIIFKVIAHDECAGNPLSDCDAMGSIFSLCPRHVNHISREQAEDYIKEHGEDAVPLSYFEHGLCKWGVQGSMGDTPDFHWDGVDFAGLWLPDKCLIDEAKEYSGKERRDKMEEWAQQACEIYTYWCNGEVYAVTVEAYRARYACGVLFDRRDDYRHDEPVFKESCCGYYGIECAEEALKEEFIPQAKQAIS